MPRSVRGDAVLPVAFMEWLPTMDNTYPTNCNRERGRQTLSTTATCIGISLASNGQRRGFATHLVATAACYALGVRSASAAINACFRASGTSGLVNFIVLAYQW